MSHVLTTIKGREKVVAAHTATLAHEAPKTMIRRGFAAIALACSLIAVTGAAAAGQEAAEELAYCTRLYGLYWKYHANYFHHDGTWAEAELAQYNCDHGKVQSGTKELERILRDDLFVIPSERSPTYTGSARR